jgi:hypothetical protein
MYKRNEGFDPDRPPAEAKQHPKQRERSVSADSTIGAGSPHEVYPKNTMGHGKEGCGEAHNTIGHGQREYKTGDNVALQGGDSGKHSGTIAD